MATQKDKATVSLPPWYEEAAKQALALGSNVATKGYVPYMGADVAAMSPNTQAGINSFDALSAAFGMPTGGGGAGYMPQAQNFAGGVKGYSAFPAFEQAQNALKDKYPGLWQFLQSFNRTGDQGSGASPAGPLTQLLSGGTAQTVPTGFSSLANLLSGGKIGSPDGMMGPTAANPLAGKTFNGIPLDKINFGSADRANGKAGGDGGKGVYKTMATMF